MEEEEDLLTPTIGQGDVKQAEKDRTFKGRLDAFNKQTKALKILGSKDRWDNDWNRKLQTNIFNRGPLSPHSPLLDDFSNTMETATGFDPTDIKQMSAEMVGYYQDTKALKSLPLAVTKRAAARVKPEVYESIIDMALSPLKKVNQTWDDFLYMIGGGVGTGTGVGTTAYTVKRWEKFGYGLDRVEPKQVTNPRFTANQKLNVANSLEEFYNKVRRFEASGKPANKYFLYWINPETNDIYKVTRKRIGLNRTRLHLESKNRYFRENLQSSPIQKQNISLEKSNIAKKNKILEEDFLTLRDFYKAELDKLDLMIESRGGGGKPGSARGLELESWRTARTELANQLDDLLEGKAEFYGEHGYNLANERVQNIVRGLPKFSLGDRKNFFPTLNKGGFKTFKDNLESVINSTNRQTGEYNYPQIVVNYNPNLHNKVEYIIRLENKSTIRLGGPKGVYPNQVYGDLIQDLPNGIDFFNDIPESVRRAGSREGGTRAIREWLESIGITPTPDPSQVEPLRKYIPTTTRPKTTRKQTREEILDQAIKDAGLDRD